MSEKESCSEREGEFPDVFYLVLSDIAIVVIELYGSQWEVGI